MKLNKTLLRLLLTCGFVTILMPSHNAFAKRESMQKRLQKEKTIRRQKLLLDQRLELSVSLGSSLGEVYKQSYPLGISGTYHLSNEFALAASAFFALSSETQLTEEIRRVRPNRIQDDSAFSSVGLGLGVDAVYTPVYGKFSLLGISALKYDLSGTVGFHLLQVSGAESDGFKPALALGLAAHFFIDDSMAVGVFYKNFLYSRNDHVALIANKLEAEAEFSIHSFGGLSFSYFTGKAQVESE
jgi:outer membrane beta-barrel protein